jgi:hypothetical protein
MPMKGTQGSEPTQLTSYCEKHLPVCLIWYIVSFPPLNDGIAERTTGNTCCCPGG